MGKIKPFYTTLITILFFTLLGYNIYDHFQGVEISNFEERRQKSKEQFFDIKPLAKYKNWEIVSQSNSKYYADKLEGILIFYKDYEISLVDACNSEDDGVMLELFKNDKEILTVGGKLGKLYPRSLWITPAIKMDCEVKLFMVPILTASGNLPLIKSVKLSSTPTHFERQKFEKAKLSALQTLRFTHSSPLAMVVRISQRASPAWSEFVTARSKLSC